MKSHRQVFRSSAVIGGASVINMVIGIAKVKVLAVLLGPVGIGLMGMYQNIMAVASAVAGCGLGTSGVRQLAAAADDAKTVAIVRQALWTGSLVLGLAGMVFVWLLRESLAQWVFGNATYTSEVGWLGVGLLLTLIAGSQTALLQGLRRIDDLAKVSILSAIVGALAGVLAVYFLGQRGVLWFVIIAPAANVLVASYYARRLPRGPLRTDPAALREQWQALLKLGIPLMAAGLVMLLTQLVVRSIVLRELGLDASGFFQAAWAISMIYVGFVLNAMAMDYYPRLSAAISEHSRARQLVSEQAEMALLLAAPALLAMVTLAPWVIQLLYTPSFGPAADVLRWQVLGDVLKVATVPVVFVFLATGHGGIAIGIQLLWSAIYLAALALGLERFGLIMTGIGFALAYLVYYVAVVVAANRLIGYKPTRRNFLFPLLLLVSGGATIVLTATSTAAALSFGALATLIVSVYSLRRLNDLIDVGGWLRTKLR